MRRRADDLTWIVACVAAVLLLSPSRRALFAAGWTGPFWAWLAIIGAAFALSWVWTRRVG